MRIFVSYQVYDHDDDITCTFCHELNRTLDTTPPLSPFINASFVFFFSPAKLVLRHPRLMAYRVTSHVAPKTKWLRERLGLGQPQLRKVFDPMWITF